MGKQIHITGCAPRSGTSLMIELFGNCFEVDAYAKHELSIARYPKENYNILVSKHPGDIIHIKNILYLAKKTWIIYMIRDPRDVVVSRHRAAPDCFWVSLDTWKRQHSAAEKLIGHPRFIPIKYEDLVSNPDLVQQRLQEKIPFLLRKVNFSEYHEVVEPWSGSVRALGGVRPITSNSVGSWREQKPRLLAQLEMHGPISTQLIELGYEHNDAWLTELEGIRPENGETRLPEKWTVGKRFLNKLLTIKHALTYVMGVTHSVSDKVHETGLREK